MDMLVITSEEADQIRGRHGDHSAIYPIPLPDGTFMVPKSCLYSDDLISIRSTLETMTGNTQEIPLLPPVGFPVYSGVTYSYDDPPDGYDIYSQFVLCRQDHTRTIYPPYDTPALFTFTRLNSDNLEWIPNELVEIGWKRIYSGVTYVVNMAHLTQYSWIPPLTLGTLWALPSDGSWAIGVYYNVNDEVTYGGDTYICLQSHTSQAGWEPPNVPALWELI